MTRLWLTPLKSLPIPCKRLEKLLNTTSMVFPDRSCAPFHAPIVWIRITCLQHAHNPLNMVNEPGKMSNLNTLHLRRYVDRWKKTEWQTRTEIWIPLQSWGFSLSKAWNFLRYGSIYEGMHDDISQTFSNFYQGMVRSYHGTMPGVMFFKH